VSEIRYLCKMIGGVPVLEAPAEIDITTADELRAVLLATAALGYVTVVVDLTVTRFCDCCGLHALLRAHQLAQADGGELRLVIPADGLVPRILALTCLDRSIPCFASLREAVAQTPAAANGRRDARGPDADQPPCRPRFNAGGEAADQFPALCRRIGDDTSPAPLPGPEPSGPLPDSPGPPSKIGLPTVAFTEHADFTPGPCGPARRPPCQAPWFSAAVRGSACACRISLL
jgi:anti-sigma B factor antagonist